MLTYYWREIHVTETIVSEEAKGGLGPFTYDALNVNRDS
jgi:hypothetical protein